LLVSSQNGKLTIEKYITVFKNQSKLQKDVFVSTLLMNLTTIIFTVDGVDILISLIEQWGVDYLEIIVKSSYLNEVINDYKDTLSDNGINLLFHKLLTNLKPVRKIINLIFLNLLIQQISTQSAFSILNNIPNYEAALLNTKSAFYKIVELAFSKLCYQSKKDIFKFIKKHKLMEGTKRKEAKAKFLAENIIKY
jgi:hypothetical protein